MNKQHKAVHAVAATVFTIVTLVHVLRLSYGWPVVIGSWAAPLWLSWIGVFLAGSLAVLLWKHAR